MRRNPPRRSSTPEVSQSVIQVLQNYYDKRFQGNGREIFSLIFMMLVGGFVLYKLLAPSLTPSNQNQTLDDNVALASEQIETLAFETTETQNTAFSTNNEPDSPYIINPLTHTGWQSYLVAPGDTLTQVLKKAGLSLETWQEIMALGKHARYISRVHPGQMINIESRNGLLIALNQPLDPVRTLYVVRQKDGSLASFIHEKELQTRVAFGSANIEDSLFLSGRRANIDDNILMQLSEIFGCVVDFAHDIHPNDNFKVLYEEQFVDGEKIGTGHVLAIEFHNNGKTHQAIRYTDTHGKVGYYSPNGMSLKRAFLRTPVKFSRISSYFTHQRKHPILHKIRAHKGVDYVAPTGTPVKAVGDGVVAFQGRKGGYGKTLILEHGGKRSTLYAHLSGFAKNVAPGKRVSQGQVIGYVGSSGLATGAHLHYEFRVDGQHRDPLTVPLPHSVPIPVQQRQMFLAQASELMGLLEYHEKIMMASNEY